MRLVYCESMRPRPDTFHLPLVTVAVYSALQQFNVTVARPLALPCTVMSSTSSLLT